MKSFRQLQGRQEGKCHPGVKARSMILKRAKRKSLLKVSVIIGSVLKKMSKESSKAVIAYSQCTSNSQDQSNANSTWIRSNRLRLISSVSQFISSDYRSRSSCRMIKSMISKHRLIT